MFLFFVADWLPFLFPIFSINTMVNLYSVAKPLLICGYHGLGSMVLRFVLLSALAPSKPVIKIC